MPGTALRLMDALLDCRYNPFDEAYATITVRHDHEAGSPSRAGFRKAMRTGVVTSVADKNGVTSRHNTPAKCPVCPVLVRGLDCRLGVQHLVERGLRNAEFVSRA